MSVGLSNRLAAGLVLVGVALADVQTGRAQSAAQEPVAEQADGFELPAIEIHGFVSQGAFLSTDNDYIGHSERGSLEFLEAAVNVSSGLTDRLRAGAQLFTRDFGPIGNYTLTLDWAYLDYRWRDWLGVRAGRIKMPFGLYNEFADIDSARLSILLPQSVYSIQNRDFLLSQTGFAVYGSVWLPGAAGGLDYQAFAGTIFVDPQSSALTVTGPVELDAVDTKYAAGAQAFWRTPVAGLRVGASYLHTNLAFQFHTDPLTASQLIMGGLVPPDFDGTFEYGYRDIDLAVGSVEWTPGDWLFSAEYSRWMFQIYSSIPQVFGDSEEDSERFYGMVARRIAPWLEAGAYYSVIFVDADDRDGSGDRFTERHRAFRKDLAGTVRFDVNDFWLWKLEAHYMDGTGELVDDDLADPDNLARRWGFFLVKTTVTF